MNSEDERKWELWGGFVGEWSGSGHLCTDPEVTCSKDLEMRFRMG